MSQISNSFKFWNDFGIKHRIQVKVKLIFLTKNYFHEFRISHHSYDNIKYLQGELKITSNFVFLKRGRSK